MYEYVNLQGRPSINKNSNLAKAAYILYKFKPLIPRKQKRWKSVIKYLMLFRQNKIMNNTKLLPIYGDLALEVNGTNHKVFNLKHGIVYTLYDEKYEKLIENQLLLVDSHKMCEGLINIDKKNRVIEEKLFNGRHPNFNVNSAGNIKKLSKLFYELVINSEIKIVNTTMYANSLRMDILSMLDNIHHIDKKVVEAVKKVTLEKHCGFLKKNKLREIHLILSHGDIKHENLIEKGGGFIPIDWEFTEFRSPVFDLLKFIFRDNYDTSFYEKLIKQTAEKSGHQDFGFYFYNIKKIYFELYSLEYIKHRLIQFERRHSENEVKRMLMPVLSYLENIDKYMSERTKQSG